MTTVVDADTDDPGEAVVLKAETVDGKARLAALSVLRSADHAPTSVVSYDSRGHVLIVTGEEPDLGVVQRVQAAGMKCSLLVGRPAAARASLGEGPGNTDLLSGRVAGFSGHLGEFRVILGQDPDLADAAKLAGLGDRGFDLVLDLGPEKLVTQEVLPLGYFAPTTPAQVEEAIEALPDFVGEFDKPKFFKLDPSICAHTSRGIVGCTRCLDVCPATAIISAAESVEVDPYLCQGVGACTTVCPTGAITYVFPRVSDLLDGLRRALHRYHDEKGTRPALIFHDDEEGRRWLGKTADSLPEYLIPVEVENVGSVGMDAWLSCLAYGAHHVFLLAAEGTVEGVATAIRREVTVANTILRAMGYPASVSLLAPENESRIVDLMSADIGKQLTPPAGFAAFDEKRTTLRLALDHLHEHAPKSRKSVALDAGAPFGRVKVDRQACTLCMSCAAVCPSAALTDGGGLPRLLFTERNCVQCGMCETACPEDAVEIEARFLFDAQQRDRARVMHEEEPFNCVKCGKPFSTQSMISKIREKLGGHWMYQDPAQVRRLEMCDNCRIEDIYLAGGGMDPYDKPGPSGSKV